MAAVFAGNLIGIYVQVDCASILANPQVDPSQVIFMNDNNAAGGSTGEGTNELTTACHPGDTLTWACVNMNPANGYTVQILGFRNSVGNVFGNNPPSLTPAGFQGTVVSAGQETYQLNILVGGTTPYSWDPHISSS